MLLSFLSANHKCCLLTRVVSVILCAKNSIQLPYKQIITWFLRPILAVFPLQRSISHTRGTDRYKNLQGYQWKWGFDDGWDVLKTLKVINKQNKYLNK